MQWSDEANAGFTTGKPWLKVNPNAREINVEAQRQDPRSIFHFYRRLIALRKERPALARGDLSFLDTGSNELIALTRSLPGERLLAVFNFSAEAHTLPARLLEGAGEALLSSYDRQGGCQGPALRPYEAALFPIN